MIMNNRDQQGRFVKGNRASRGNSTARKVAAFRSKLFECITDKDFREVIERLTIEAKLGRSWACKLLLSYCLGEPTALDLIEKIEQIEELLGRSSEEEKRLHPETW